MGQDGQALASPEWHAKRYGARARAREGRPPGPRGHHHSRHPLPPASTNGDRLSEALDALQAVLITDIGARQQRLRLYRPDGGHAPGNTLIGTLRQLPGVPTDQDEKQAEYFEIEVDHLATGIREQLDLAEEMSSAPEVALHASVRALLRSFTAEQIADALKQKAR